MDFNTRLVPPVPGAAPAATGAAGGSSWNGIPSNGLRGHYGPDPWSGPTLPEDNDTFPRRSLSGTGRFSGLGGDWGANAQKTALKKQSEDWSKMQAEMTAMATSLFDSMFSNIENGWGAMVRSMEQTFLSMVARIAAQKAAAWLVGAVLGGPAGGAAGVSMSDSFGLEKAVVANKAMRAGRG